MRGYASTFIARVDQHPLQRPDGRYISVKKPLNLRLVASHLKGEVTLGAYALDANSQAKWVCLDADDDPEWHQLVALSRHLSTADVPSYLEFSRRGGHVWFFFAAPIPGAEARRFGQQLMTAYALTEMELFPKQDVLTTGPGSLVRLPLGIHRKTGRRYYFIHPDGSPIASTIRQQIQLLAHPQTVPQPFIHALLARAPVTDPRVAEPVLSPTGKGAGETLSTRIKDRITVYAFVSQYVALNERGQGHCPFHNDHHASFSVDQERNYWHCFAGCGGGSVIDFWIKWREMHGQDADFTATIKDLAEILF